MTNKEALDILDHNWTKLVNPDYTDVELGKAQDLAIKALHIVEIIENCFKQDTRLMILMMGFEDWGEIKEEAENDK